MDGEAWWAAVHGVAKSWTRLSDFPFTFHFHAFEKEMATHSSVLAWRIPGTVEPGGLPSMGSHRVGHNWSDLATHIICNIILPLLGNIKKYWGICHYQGFPGSSEVKNLPAIGYLGNLRFGKIPWRVHGNPCILAWRIPWTEDSGGLLWWVIVHGVPQSQSTAEVISHEYKQSTF